ncbi:MAG: methionyl-tRNA formyltransferase [Candidatus Komeilibacteria bacterium CG11_big_fil_rev_8_21_14_0_20_36_20]|uniref:Methionyl-tRNA formyltransferase n=1 Tax=Candidatus Komeilibacteria bacterium CG11_big_fil_rev_8_21_14_0_20_36_20 TaxID=1974477 RepID=A0A2H0NC04_9BACT|nr:MAG: methionyl-tRNA formyltransferase [Candidatus Komeilibacteria bacterium CG11_big_fil_rev_8_21_14_0_20_36_20]PIR81968.1 MAG: methionyl-tRNA formyltransferase [Candidatus Komeilibacteria bacterium CG10_big_fil_rev_8_21_14_0_10_36_65]PJC55506.1 MAG: methionyl-tRNA formyltransferase [Candidatus Komeilibacteria bacterium CG_4_9_14_0_2_um_filter_36_13]
MIKTDKKIIFWGTPDFALPGFQTLQQMGLVRAVVTQPDKPAGRNKKTLSSPIKIEAQKNNLPVLEPEIFNNEFINDLKKYLPATFMIIAYGRIIPDKILKLSELLALNIHPSQLPLLRGPSPIQTALLKGFKITGISLMQLDSQMDHGPLLAQEKIEINPEDNFLTLSKKLTSISQDILAKNVIKYLSNQLTPLPQDHQQATFCKIIKKEDGRIDWLKPAQEINNQIRAFNPWPSAFFDLNGLNIKIFKAQITENNLKPAEILIDQDKLIIGTSQKSLEILELQPAGKKIMRAAEFIRGYQRYLSQ